MQWLKFHVHVLPHVYYLLQESICPFFLIKFFRIPQYVRVNDLGHDLQKGLYIIVCNLDLGLNCYKEFHNKWIEDIWYDALWAKSQTHTYLMHSIWNIMDYISQKRVWYMLVTRIHVSKRAKFISTFCCDINLQPTVRKPNCQLP